MEGFVAKVVFNSVRLAVLSVTSLGRLLDGGIALGFLAELVEDWHSTGGGQVGFPGRGATTAELLAGSVRVRDKESRAMLKREGLL